MYTALYIVLLLGFGQCAKWKFGKSDSDVQKKTKFSIKVEAIDSTQVSTCSSPTVSSLYHEAWRCLFCLKRLIGGFPTLSPQCSSILPSTTSVTLQFPSATLPSLSGIRQCRHITPRSSSGALRCCSVCPPTCTAAPRFWTSAMDLPLIPTDRPPSTWEPASRVAAVTQR